MTSKPDLTTDHLMEEIGRKLEQIRIDRQIPDAEVILRGGIKKDSWYNLKAGRNVTLSNFIRALRGLDCLDMLDDLLEYVTPASPMDLVTKRKPAGRKRFRTPGTGSDTGFRWGDEE